MKTEKNMRKGFGLAGKIAVFCIGLVSLVLTRANPSWKSSRVIRLPWKQCQFPRN